MNWSKAGNKSYPVSSANVKPIGSYIADFLLNSKAKIENVHVIGHSLGAMVASYVGKSVYNKTGSKIGRITATDPAGPGFEQLVPELRLNPNDAEFLDVIHTDVGHYGFGGPIGHVDYYPNGGRSQPGCPPLDVDGELKKKN